MRIKTLFPLLFMLLIPWGLFGQYGLFWEQPEVFSEGQGSFPVTAYNDNFGVLVWQESVRRPAAVSGVGDGSISVSLAVKNTGESWEKRGTIGGPYFYSGTEPSILSVIIDDRDRILIAAAASATEIEILVSEDRGRSFNHHRMDSGTETSLAPRIAVCADGSYLLFVTRGSESALSIYYARSSDGVFWSPFQPFVTDSDMRLNFLPSHTSFRGVEYVVFQSFTRSAETVPSFQLFFKTSADGGRNWSPSRRFTQFMDAFTNPTASPDNFDNQRPHLSVQGDSLFLVWERRYRAGSPQIYAARVGAGTELQGAAELVSSAGAYSNNPIAFNHNGDTGILWFDNRRGGNHVYLARRAGLGWEETELPGPSAGEASFGRPVADRDGLCVFWQNSDRGNIRIYSLIPDTSVTSPRLRAANFTPSRRTRGDRVQVSWNIPPDSSGIQGFSYLWSRDDEAEPVRTVQMYNTEGTPPAMELSALEDGLWYFSVIAQDYAGNWSAPARIEYFRDTTPPPAASIIPPALDDQGYLLSNTFSLSWNPPPASDISGYAWNLEYLDSGRTFTGMDYEQFTAEAERVYPSGPAGTTLVRGTGTSASYNNQDDGIWRFTVRAVDESGNVGPLSALYFRTNKYVPHTYITFVDAAQDETGTLGVRVIGRGFAQGGDVTRLFLDADGTAPFDREFLLSRQDFEVASDREIRNLRVSDIDEGLYRVGVEHPGRGIVFSAAAVTVTGMGTVKFGDYSAAWKPSWILDRERRFSFDTAFLILISVFVFCGLGLVVSARGIGETLAEGAAIRLDAAALITGDLMPSEKKKRLAGIKKRGIGLRFKLASFTIVLVMLVVLMVSAPLYVMMTRNQRQTLVQGLWDRSTVLLEGLATSAQAYLPLRSVLELGFLPSQMNSVPEARYITITGYNTETTVFDDQVWGTNDPDILAKIDSAVFEPGISRISDVLSPRLSGIADELNERARLEVGSLSESIVALNREGVELALLSDEASIRRLEDIQVQVRTLQARVNERLAEISRAIGSEPEFSVNNFVVSPDNRYIFFKPVMYRQGSDDVYFRGLVRLEVSIDSILEKIGEEQKTLIRIILLVALVAILIGAFGALILSTLIIRPIRQLVRHVEIIRDTDDKARLAGVDIRLGSRDEIAILGDTINDMTHGLVNAAIAASDLSIGKEIQKKFIPLELDKAGNKLSFGSKDTKTVNFFGYYEGAKGVSGDYFDFLDLDGRYYAIIKCDVAGKGVPAALIMIQVATMFLNYFKQWKPTEKGMHIEDVVYQINDFIETLGFKSRFAAFTLCLYDSQTGTARFCNAGDNLIHLYDASEGRVKTLTLPESPATGVLPNFLVDSKGGYTVQTMTLDHGDILLLYTDGIEEAKRKFRDTNFREITCGVGENDTPHENHVAGQGDEEMGADRVEAIVNAVMNKQIYSLNKWHNPEGDDRILQFDFRACRSTVEEVIMAMVSVEKMFRCYRAPNATEENQVLVDKTIDAFLKEHFLQYRDYCYFTRENPGSPAYMYYTHVGEDEQYDDLTLLGIKRK